MEPIVAGAIAEALGSMLLGKGAEVVKGLLSDPSWRKTLATKAATEAGISVASPAVLAWLERPETVELLTSEVAPDRVERLEETLAQELTSDWVNRVGTLPEEDIDLDSIAKAILARATAGFIASLDAAAAVAISDKRSQARHEEIRERLTEVEARLPAGDRFEEELKKLPPISRQSLAALGRVDQPRASALIRLITAGTQRPAEAIRDQLRGPEPDLLVGAPAEFWLAFADLATIYDARDVEGAALKKAASLGAPTRARLFARAALALMAAGKSDEAQECLKQAKSIGETDRFVQLLDSVIGGNEGAILPLSDGLPNFVQGIPVGLLRAIALVNARRTDDAIELLRSALREEPEWTSGTIWLANLLLSKAEESRGDAARALKKEAMELARQARDLRRRWAGSSGECVEVMARAAISLGDRRLAFEVSTVEGEATPEEARSPAVLATLVTLLLDRGDIQQAAELAKQIESPFHQLLARGALAADTGRRPEAEGHLRQALELARHEAERVSVLRYMATAGIWPLPELEKVREWDPEMAAVMEASSLITRGDPTRAIAVLRPFRRTSSRTARMLATAYQRAGHADDAVRELTDGARHFSDPELTAEAAFLLSETGRHDQAFNLASRAAYELPPDSTAIPKVRALLFNGLAARRDWPGAEEQARRLLEIRPTSAEAGWGLVISLVNQSRLEEAWFQVKERRLDPQTEEQAGLWVSLAARYTPVSEWTVRALNLVERFRDAEQLHALVLFSTVRAREGELPPEVGERVKKSWADFIERFPQSEILFPQRIGETDDEMLQILRSILEPGAQAALEQARAVEDGRAPLGLLATAARRSYTEAWLVGGAGVLFVYIPVKQINEMETAAAAAAPEKEVVLDGSALAILSLLPDVAGTVIATFARGRIPTSLRRDAAAAHDSFASPSAGMLGWDPEAGRPTMTSHTPEEIGDWQRRAKWIEELAVELDAVDVGEFPDLPDAKPEVWGWLASLQLAKSEKLSFYCDDAWLRRLAASFGVSAFGTVDLLGVLSATGQITAAQRTSALRTLRMRRAVAIPIGHAELIDLAASEAWSGGIAALQLAQSTYWSNREAGQDYERMLMLAGRHNPAGLPVWLFAGTLGATRNAPEATRPMTSSRFLATAIAHYAQADIVPNLVSAARGVAKRVGVGDPLPASAPLLRDLLVSRLGYRKATVFIIALTARLDPDDARVLRLPFFMPASSS